jgi:hypothetical protein
MVKRSDSDSPPYWTKVQYTRVPRFTKRIAVVMALRVRFWPIFEGYEKDLVTWY